MNSADLLVAIPAFNESATVAAVIAEVRQAVPTATVLVVDDGSNDDTATVASKAGASVVTMPFNVGVGGAMRTAFLYAQSHGFQAVVQVDADGQHDPQQIPLLVAELAQFDVVVGARFAGEGEYEVHGPRKWAMSILSVSLSKIVHAKLTDTTSGFRAAGPRAIELFARRYPSQYLGDTVESLVLAARSGLTVTQVPVVMRPRQGGTPSHSPAKAALYLGRAVMALGVAVTRKAEAGEA